MSVNCIRFISTSSPVGYIRKDLIWKMVDFILSCYINKHIYDKMLVKLGLQAWLCIIYLCIAYRLTYFIEQLIKQGKSK